MKVQIFIPCFIDQLFPSTAFNMIKVLEKLGCQILYNDKQTCCGQPAYNAGFRDISAKICHKFFQDFNSDTYIVTPSASCVGFVKNYASALLQEKRTDMHIQQTADKVIELTDFIVNVLKVKNIGATFNGTATYHSSCAALRECHIKKEPLLLLENVAGLKMVEMPNNDTCCGFGGTFAVKYNDISAAMGEQKLEASISTNADYIISTDLSCLMHIHGIAKQKNSPIKVLHIVDVLANF